MKNIRVFMNKEGCVKYTSHLDMNRYMLRVLKRSKLPIWYTEGFNPHPYITFALPLSLGFESRYEVMDMKIAGDDLSNDAIKAALTAAMPVGLTVWAVAEPVLKPGKIAFASFEIAFSDTDDTFAKTLEEFLNSDTITTEKKGKKGKISTVELAGRFSDMTVILSENIVTLNITLPAGSSDNVNPLLYFSAASERGIEIPQYKITRTALLDADKKLFV